MFFLIRKIVIVTFWLLALLVGVVIYEKRALFAPVVEFVQIAREMTFVPKERADVGEMVGKVGQVMGPDLFRIKNTAGVTYYFKLGGVHTLEAWQLKTKQERRVWEQAKTNLSELILSNRVRIDVTATNQNLGGLGIVYRDGTNVNLKLVEQGMVEINRDFIKTLPLKEQYAFLLAQKRAKEQKLGLWQ